MTETELQDLADNIKIWGRELGFQQIGITHIELDEHEARLKEWLAKGYHGSMEYMAAHVKSYQGAYGFPARRCPH